MPGQAGVLQTLRGIVGPDHVRVDGALDGYLLDARGRYRGRALAIVTPMDAAQVAAVVRACVADGAPIVPQGGNTGLVGGGVPDDSGRAVLLSLQRMRTIRAIDPDNLAMVVDAGCTLQQVQDHARTHGLRFPLDIGSRGSCTIGGNLATNAGGTQVLRHGNARALCLGLEVVTPAGDLWDGLSSLRKDNAGYDLRDLFIGSEGSLGVITGASLALVPMPHASATALVACAGMAQAVALLRVLRAAHGDELAGFEVMSRHALGLVRRHFPGIAQPLEDAPWNVLLELEGSDREGLAGRLHATLSGAVDQGIAGDVAVTSSHARRQVLWALREAIPQAQAREGLNVKHDIALPVSAIAGFVAAMDAALPRIVPGLQPVVFGHLGDGNLHFNVQAPAGMSAAAFLEHHEAAINACVHDAVMARGGSFAAEHGIGRLRRAELAGRVSPVALALMRSLKAALDPQGLMNPGCVLDDSHHP